MPLGTGPDNNTGLADIGLFCKTNAQFKKMFCCPKLNIEICYPLTWEP